MGPPERRLREFNPSLPPAPRPKVQLGGSQWLVSCLAFSEGHSSGKDALLAASLCWLVSGLSANTT